MVAFAINTRHPVRVHFCRRVRAAWLKNGRFALRRRRRAVHFRTRRLVEASLGPASPDRFEKPHGSQSRNVTGIFWNIKTDFDVALRRQMVHLLRRQAVNQIQNPFGAGQITVMKEQLCSRVIGILINVIDARSIERAGAPDDPVDFIPFRKQKLRQVRAVLACDSRDERTFHALGPLRISQNHAVAQLTTASSCG